MSLNYCKLCVTPTSRPKLKLNEEGICSACVSAREKMNEIDWKKREAELKALLEKFRSKDKSKYDCIIPVSGGKDSIYQVHILKNVYHMNPLCVTFRTDSRTKIGEHNIQALRDMGVDHIDFTPNPVGFKKLCKKTFEEVGDCSIADHLSMCSLGPQMALRYNVPLVIWGENADMEYGADANERKNSMMNSAWLRNQNIFKGKKAEDWIDKGLPLQEIKSLVFPGEKELEAIDYTPIFLGYYIPWDAKRNVDIAKKYGFIERSRPILGLYNYADLDCMRIVIHHYFKWLKFGFNRVTDNASNEIRKGRMTRKEAIKLVKGLDGLKPPKEYIKYFCDYIGITEKHFWEVADKFRNKDIWKKNKDGEWYIEGWIGGDNLPDRFPNEPLFKDEA